MAANFALTDALSTNFRLGMIVVTALAAGASLAALDVFYFAIDAEHGVGRKPQPQGAQDGAVEGTAETQPLIEPL